MDWYKHMTGSHEDPDISDAEDEFGDAGYAVFFKVLEIYGREFRRLNGDGWLSLSKRKLCRNLRKKWKRTELLLTFYHKRGRILLEQSEKRVSIKIPKFIEMASNWTKRQKDPPTEAPTEEPTATPTAIEGEVEEEVNKEERPKEEQTPPSKEEINESSIPKIESDLDRICQELYDKKIFPKAHAFRNTKAKAGKNKRAMLHALCRALLKKTFTGNPWEYCERIMQVEHGNFNERDYQKTA